MLKSLVVGLIVFQISSSATPQAQIKTYVPAAKYRSASLDHLSWQRLNLLMSTTYYRVAKEGVLDFNSCLVYTSRSLGLSRLPLLAEGIDDSTFLSQSQWVDQKDPGMGIRFLSQTTGKKHLEALVLLGAYYAFEPRNNYHTDSVEYFLIKAIHESKILKESGLRRQALCLLGKMYVQTNESKKGDSVFTQVINECRLAADKKTEARAFEYWGLFPEYNPTTTQTRINYFQKAADLYHELNNPEREIHALTDVGYLLVTTAQLQKAYENFMKALQLAEAIYYPYTHYNTAPLSMVTMFAGKFGEPLKFTIESIKTAEANRDSIGWGSFYERLGALYSMERGREDESLKWLLKALDRYVIEEDAAGWLTLGNIASIMSEQGRGKELFDLALTLSKKIPPKHANERINYSLALGGSYTALKQFKMAEQYVLEADEIRKKSATLRDANFRSRINSQLGAIYFGDRQFKRSQKHLEASVSESLGDKALGSYLFLYNLLVKIDSILGDAPSAVLHYKRLTQLLDSNYQVSKIRQAEELQVMYQTQEKEKQISLLQKQSKLEQTNLKQSTNVKNVSIAGMIAVMVIAMLLLRQSGLRQKHNKLITHKNEQLQHYLTEKEWLLKEIHHRVKNNLQIVMSLLNSQSAFIDNEPALTAIHDSQHRVHAMSLIHQKLYNSENLSSIEMSIYIRELVSYLSDSFESANQVRFELHITPLVMDVSQAVPLGLILNEAITNALKYAFPKGIPGVISISLEETMPENFLLTIADDGIGIPQLVGNKKAGSLGMSLMAGLSEDLDGKFSIENNNGTIIKIWFVHDLAVRHADSSLRSNVATT